MVDILKEITKSKKAEVAQLISSRDAHELPMLARDRPPPRGFKDALKKASVSGYGLIAEFKRASPSKGVIRADADPKIMTKAYQDGGATCLSILTDTPYFQGSLEDLTAACEASTLPILRKDFIIDPIQITETRAKGGDCILLIMAMLEDNQARDLEAVAIEHGLDVLIETHNAEEIERAKALTSPLIGINNRNLRTMKTDHAPAENLLSTLPQDAISVAESGLSTPDDLKRMARLGARCFLIGEALMRQNNVSATVATLLANPLPHPDRPLNRKTDHE